ncbi:MAG: penicillin-binding protein 1A, partial [Xanthomonadales bacterium]|nr:penicillin-binding protein 1A [Xanthomonadales bacterium]
MTRLALAGIVTGALAIAVAWMVFAPDLPDVETLRDVQLQVPLRVYSADNRLMSVFGEKRRIPVALEEVPDPLVNAFLAGEDARFYEHPGVDYQGLSRAVWTLVTTGEKSVGGSTITQQLARNFFLSFEKTYTRKIKEIFLALKIERELSKEQILELYLNKIYLGNRAYGVGAAAQVYYGKTLDELTLAQSAMIAALPKAPSRVNPIASPERALERRNYVLARMREQEFIGEDEFRAALAERDNAYYHGATAEVSAPYLSEMVRADMLARFGEDAYTAGFRVWTTLDSTLQAAANEAVTRGLEAYDRRHGYRGAEGSVDLAEARTPEAWQEALSAYRPVAGLAPGLVIEIEEDLALVFLADGQTVALDLEDVSWARPFISRDRQGAAPKTMPELFEPGDVIRLRVGDEGEWTLSQVPEVEGALVSVDPSSGAVRALVGGYDFSRSKYNRVTQSRRQPGSSFKPFVYSAALEAGFTTASVINDAPIVFEDTELERTWKPQNFSEQFYGPTRLREAMVNSRNLVSIRLLRDVGVDRAREYITGFGFDSGELPRNLSMALGSASLTPLSMATAYAVFANGGYRVEPYWITRVEDGQGRLRLEQPAPILCDDCRPEPAIEPDAEIEAVLVEAAPRETPEFRPLAISNASGDVDVVIDPGPEAPYQPPEPEYAQRVISEQNAWLVRSMMQDVIRRGTGRKAMELGRNDLAGKTGTTNEQRDAWFSGYNDALVTTVWVGFDSHEPLGRGELGGRAALPVWM